MNQIRLLTAFLLLTAVCGAADAPADPEEIVFDASVDDVVYLSRFSGKVVPVHFDPRFVFTATIRTCSPAIPPFEVGESVSFAIHSPAHLFGPYEESKGATFTFSVIRTVENGIPKFTHLKILKKTEPNQSLQPTPIPPGELGKASST